MLKILRKHTKTVVWFIVLAFALWGGSSLLVGQSRSASYVGEIFDQKVSYKEYTDISKMLNIFAVPITLSKDSQDAEIWLYLTLKREAARREIHVLDEEVKAQIRQMFGGEKTFSTMGYEQWVQNVLREKPRNFEELVREFIRIQKLIRELNRQPVEVSDEEIKAELDRENKFERLDDTTKEKYRNKIAGEKVKTRLHQWMEGLRKEANIKRYYE